MTSGLPNYGNSDLELSESDVTRLDLVARADIAYQLAASEHDNTDKPTVAQKRKLQKARAALRLACSVHVSTQENGD